jgi:hypothetical protein
LVATAKDKFELPKFNGIDIPPLRKLSLRSSSFFFSLSSLISSVMQQLVLFLMQLSLQLQYQVEQQRLLLILQLRRLQLIHKNIRNIILYL